MFLGRNPSIYKKWSEANAEVCRYPGACFKGYETMKEAEEAFNSFKKKACDAPTCSQSNSCTSNSDDSGTSDSKSKTKLGPLLKAVAELARENCILANKMEKNSDEIRSLVEQMSVTDDE